MNTLMKTTLAAALTLLTINPAFANSGRSLSDGLAGHSRVSTGAVLLSTAVAGSVAAVPLMSVGVVGEKIGQGAIGLGVAALAPNNPLRITNRTIVSKQPLAGTSTKSPADAMK
ncbi:MAG: hypothetical protein KUG59_04840 [Parvibaculaceae bacterium]|nr:hypothetical protein [Parvibaculaceae bacterium]